MEGCRPGYTRSSAGESRIRKVELRSAGCSSAPFCFTEMVLDLTRRAQDAQAQRTTSTADAGNQWRCVCVVCTSVVGGCGCECPNYRSNFRYGQRPDGSCYCRRSAHVDESRHELQLNDFDWF